MEAGFTERLAAALEKKREQLEAKTLPRLKERLMLLQTLFESIYNVLIRKSLLHPDPYKNEQKITTIAPPPAAIFSEGERIEKMSQRLSEYHSLLDFLNLTIELSLEYLTLERVRQILSLVKYINWQNLSETSPDINTSSLANLVAKIRGGSDNLSAGILRDSLDQLKENNRQIIALLADISLYQREYYKLVFRREVLPRLEVPPDRPEAYQKALRQIFPRAMPGRPLYTDLVEEVAAEDASTGGPELQARALEKLVVKEVRPERKVPARVHRAVLLEAIRLLIRAGAPLAEALKKTQENRLLLENRRKKLGRRLREWLFSSARRRAAAEVFEVEYLDPATSASRAEQIHFTAFYEDASRKARLYAALANRAGVATRRLETAAESQVYEFLDRNLAEMQVIRRRLEGLAAFFRGAVLPAERSQLKGIRLELTAIQNHLVNANKKKHEYVARKEEEEQMRRLGIEPVS